MSIQVLNSLTTKKSAIEQEINRCTKRFLPEELRVSKNKVKSLKLENFLKLLENDLGIEVKSYLGSFKIFGIKLTNPKNLKTKWITFSGWDLSLKVSNECDNVSSPKSYTYHFPIYDIQSLTEILQNEITLLAKVENMEDQEHFPEIQNYLDTIQSATRDYENFLKNKGYILVSLLLDLDLYYFAVHKDYLNDIHWKDLVYENKKYPVGAILQLKVKDSLTIITTVDLVAS